LLWGIVIIILVSLIVFFSIRLLPGDPLTIYIGQQASTFSISDQELQSLRIRYGLDKPVYMQYLSWAKGVVTGNFGQSIYYHDDVAALMAERFPRTLHLGLSALVINVVFGILFGLLAAVRRGTWIDAVVTTVANVGITVPVFWLGLLLIYIFGLKLNILPISGYTSPVDNFWLSTRQSIMPIICLAVTGLAVTARQTRSSMLEVIRQDYIRTAWSKGLAERVIIFRHALKNSLIPVVTLLGIGVSLIFGGAVLVETVFAVPGVGRLLVQSIFAQDYQVIQSGTLVIAIIVVVVNLIVDISYGWFDPRIRYG
jgi:peptide/nickel transport system permease protein